ncbi:MAG: LysR family transcriptional regulator, partial [Lacrimispora sphenoides]
MSANFEHYKVFYYVAKYKNFTRAANALLTSQPSVTCYIQNLENVLGCKLFIRSKKGVVLTSEGELLYSYVAPACMQFMQGEEALKERLGKQIEQINVGATQMAMHSYLLTGLHQFKEQFPQVRLNIFTYNTPQTLSELKAGKIDLGIITTPFYCDENIKAVKVKTFRSLLAGGKKYEEYGGKTSYLSELSTLPLITMSNVTTTFAFFQEFYHSCGLVMQPAIEVAGIDLILPVIVQNLGIGFVPEELARPALEKGEIV